MAWTVKFIQDTDATGIGTVVAVDDGGTTHTRRVNTNDQEDINRFIEESVVTLKKAQQIRTVSQAVIDKIFAPLTQATDAADVAAEAAKL